MEIWAKQNQSSTNSLLLYDSHIYASAKQDLLSSTNVPLGEDHSFCISQPLRGLAGMRMGLSSLLAAGGLPGCQPWPWQCGGSVLPHARVPLPAAQHQFMVSCSAQAWAAANSVAGQGTCSWTLFLVHMNGRGTEAHSSDVLCSGCG